MLWRTFCSRALIPVIDLAAFCIYIAFFLGMLVGSGSNTVLLFIGVGRSGVISLCGTENEHFECPSPHKNNFVCEWDFYDI